MGTVSDLRNECKRLNISGYSGKTKKELEKMVSNRLKYGIHVLKKKNMAASIKDAIDQLKITSVQIFTHGPRNRKESKLDYGAIREVTQNLNLYIHSSYPTNPWNNKPDIFKHTIDQFKASKELNAKGVVLHIPKIYPDKVANMTYLLFQECERLNLLKSQKIILEMKAVKCDESKSYESPEKINRLILQLQKKGMTYDKVCICIDTAHIYAGKAKIKTYEEGKHYLNSIKFPEWIGLIHLNGNEYDSETRAGDKHAIPFDGRDKIWNGSYKKSGCRAFIEWCKEKKIDFILEIKDHHTYSAVNAFINIFLTSS
jgi:endonuclease IV